MRLASLALLVCGLCGQPADPPLAFEVATVKHGPPGDFGAARWLLADESMNDFAKALGEQIQHPWSYAATRLHAPAESGPTIFAALEEHLGLKLESKKILVETVLVDHIDREPSGN